MYTSGLNSAPLVSPVLCSYLCVYFIIQLGDVVSNHDAHQHWVCLSTQVFRNHGIKADVHEKYTK